MSINNFNTWAKKHILDENKFDNDGYIIMENDSNFKSTGIISKIFEDHWNSFYSKYKMIIDTKRPNASKEIEKIINCSNHKLGASVFVCPNDNEVYFCHHTCKGKLCSSCGIKSQKIKTQNILEKCINTKHRHITFTIPNDLVFYFFDELTSNNILFDSVCETIYSVVNGNDDGYKFNSIEDLIRYVTRYCSRPVIVESRIINYDSNNVTWFYSDHTHEQYHEITESAFSFISKLLRHLLPSNFKSIRYYSFYNKSTSLCDKLILLVKKEKRNFMHSLFKWHNSILTSFHRFPTRCPKCGTLMELCFEVT